MPRYEYRCNDCSTVFETMRPVAARHDPTPCPGCGKPTSVLVMSLSNVQLSNSSESTSFVPQGGSCGCGGGCSCC
ncbi:MAG: FmdB family zinc ribbon protein [Candidatus Dormibacteria bacterium]